MKKRALSALLALCMLTVILLETSVPASAVAEQFGITHLEKMEIMDYARYIDNQDDSFINTVAKDHEISTISGTEINIGDYIVLGTYLTEPIVWRCVAIDDNGPLMLSDRILCLKAFDANGTSATYHGDGWGYIRKNYGSNCWSDSSIRQWLNSADATVSYSHCPPVEGTVTYNPYADEAGFLSGFTEKELKAISLTTNLVTVNEWETHREGYCDGGNKEFFWSCGEQGIDYTEYYHQYVTDFVFLLSAKQADEVYENFPEYFLTAYPTEAAVNNSIYRPASLSSSTSFPYTLNIPCNSGASYENLKTTVGWSRAYQGECGIRPAFYLNTDIELTNDNLISNDGFCTFFVDNYYNSINDLYNYESVAQGIKTSSFQIVWNTCLQALSNSDYIDISKLKNHPEYYYEVVLVEAISQKELNDDYLSALKTEAFDLALDAADVFISYDANFNSREEILEAKLTETINLFDGTSEEAHALYQAFMGCVSYKSYKDFYDEAKFIYDACKEVGSTCGDFLTELSNYQVAQQASTEVIEALKYLRSTLEDSPSKEDKNIVSAIDDFIKCYSESIEENTLRQASEAIDEQLRGTLFRAAKMIPIFGNAVDLEQAGLNAVFTFSDVLFPTTMSSESYCKIYADYAMECVLRNAMQSACSSRSTVGDDVIVGLYDLLGYTYKHEIQVAQVLAEQLYHDGLLNGLRNLFTDREERYNYDKACIKAYQADLYQILGKKTDAIREYGFAIGTLQPVTIVYFLNGKVIDCKERTVETGSTFSPSSVTANLGFFLNTKIEIASYYTDAALTKPFNENQSIYSPLSLYCNLIEIDFSINVPIIRDYSTGIYVEQNGIDETTILHTEEKLDGTSYDLIKNTLKSNAFSLYDISLLKNGTPVQPTETVTVRIPISEADTKKAGKVYRVENNSKFTDMASWIEGGYYCFNTNHFSEYVVAFEPLISDDVICDGGVNCPSNKFIDVNQKEWYHPYVDYAVTHGLFGGTSANTFEPDTPMTRAMLVTVLWRYEREPAAPANTFSDVKAGAWYFDAVSWAAANGVVDGVGNNKFDPDGNITREQMATILYRYCNWKGIDTGKQTSLGGFPDAGKVSSYAKTALQWTVAEGLVGGSDGKLLPQGSATRAQVATILMRFIENIV